VRDDQGRALVEITDSGPGIAEAERERVFDRFYRAQQQADGAADAVQGSGLGLAIVRRVALRHAATVTLGSAPAGGLRVSVRF
jgi:two-component system OmpR family sensor kinase